MEPFTKFIWTPLIPGLLAPYLAQVIFVPKLPMRSMSFAPAKYCQVFEKVVHWTLSSFHVLGVLAFEKPSILSSCLYPEITKQPWLLTFGSRWCHRFELVFLASACIELLSTLIVPADPFSEDYIPHIPLKCKCVMSRAAMMSLDGLARQGPWLTAYGKLWTGRCAYGASC